MIFIGNVLLIIKSASRILIVLGEKGFATDDEMENNTKKTKFWVH